jgi:hypothetical protein
MDVDVTGLPFLLNCLQLVSQSCIGRTDFQFVPCVDQCSRLWPDGVLVPGYASSHELHFALGSRCLEHALDNGFSFTALIRLSIPMQGPLDQVDDLVRACVFGHFPNSHVTETIDYGAKHWVRKAIELHASFRGQSEIALEYHIADPPCPTLSLGSRSWPSAALGGGGRFERRPCK